MAALVAAFFGPAISPAQTPVARAAGCTQHYIVPTYRVAATRIYHQHGHIAPRQLYRLLHIRNCAINPDATHAMQAMTLHLRYHRQIRRQHEAARGCGSPTCNRRLARWLMKDSPGEFACLDEFIMHESGWSQDIENGGRHGPPGSRAWGIPQALPPQKMSSAGPDWASSATTQIRWLRTYVRQVYGGPCQARDHWRVSKSY